MRRAAHLATRVATVIALGFAHAGAEAAPRFARASGAWNAAIWSATSCVAGALTASIPGAGDDATICAGNTVTLDSSRTVNTVIINGNLSTSAFTLTIDNTPAVTLNAGGTFAGNVVMNLDGTATVATGTSTSITFNNLTFNPSPGGARTYTLGAGSITSLSVSGNFDIVPPDAGGPARSLSVVRGTVTTLTVGGRTRVAALGNGNESVTLNTTGMTAFTSGTLVLGDASGTGINTLTAGAASITLNGATGPLFTRNTDGVFTAGTSTVTMNSAASVALTSGTFLATNAFNNLTVNMPGQAGTLGADVAVNATLLVSAGTLSNNGFAITSDGASTFQVNDGATFAMTGTSAFPPTSGGTHFSTFTFQCGAYPSCSTVSYRQTTSPLTLTTQSYGHLDLTPAGAAIQRFPAGTMTINGNLSVGNGTNAAQADAATNNAAIDINGGVSIAANATLTAPASSAFTVARDWTNSGTFTHSSGTVTFDGGTASAISGSNTFRNLTLSKSAATTVTANAGFTVNGTLTMNSSTTLADGGNTVTVNGDIANAGSHTGAGRILLTGGSAAHALSGGGSYTNLELNDANGAVLSANATVNGTLTFTSGNLGTTIANTLTIGAAGSIAGAGTSRHVTGNLAKAFSAATAFTYALGDGTNYTPIALTFAAPVTGSLVAAVTASDHPNTTAAASGIDSAKSINRYWTVKNSTITGTYGAVLTYINGTPVDRDSGATAASFVMRRGTGCSGSGGGRTCTAWGPITVSGTPNNTQAVATGVAISSGDPEADIGVGEPVSTRFAREKEFIFTRELY
jgi:hypothetical protein